MLWNKTFDNSDFDSIAGIDSLAGNLFLIGNTASDFIIMKIDSNGTLSETKNWEGTRYSEALDIISTILKIHHLSFWQGYYTQMWT